jgi:hypothetical protein
MRERVPRILASMRDRIAREIRGFALHVLQSGGLEERAANAAVDA